MQTAPLFRSADGGAKKTTAREPGQTGSAHRLQLAAMGMEAEFVLRVDGVSVRPEDVFGDPRGFLGPQRMHRIGTSYHLNTGGAVYFDTGVIEVATPVIEIEPGCAARTGRSLWEGIREVRSALDRWELSSGRQAQLTGFSTHYNISFELPTEAQGRHRTVDKLALLLSYLLPIPVMLLAANRRSTGVGVRPRGDRIEITLDFTPSAALMIATGTLIVGMVREVMRWPSFELSVLEEHDLPVIMGFVPIPHTSRKGWLARYSCFPSNPFTADVNQPQWLTSHGSVQSLREIARQIVRPFRPAIKRIADSSTYPVIEAVLNGRLPALLELPDRPPEYDDVGRLCAWNDLFPEQTLSRSRYERVLLRAIAGQSLRMHGHVYTPVGMRGWSQVVFRRGDRDTLHTFPIDYLLEHLPAWERAG